MIYNSYHLNFIIGRSVGFNIQGQHHLGKKSNSVLHLKANTVTPLRPLESLGDTLLLLKMPALLDPLSYKDH